MIIYLPFFLYRTMNVIQENDSHCSAFINRMWSSFYQQARGNVQGHGMFQRFQFVFQTGKTFLSYIYSHHLFRIRSLEFKKRSGNILCSFKQ